jgi:EAL domain-containing protein (putative c-di-GMP-specific phosphodiesterase class I)/GGDEF domain-containing protein
MTADASMPNLHVVQDGSPAQLGPRLLHAGVDAAYQPIVHLGSGAVIAYEALARPRHPDALNPIVFFEALERAGLRLAGERTAFEAAMLGARYGLPHVKLFVNASPTTLIDASFDVLELLDLAERHHLAPSDLVIEVTESEEIEDIEALAMRIRRLRRLGMGVAVDDAGAGHASFKVITRLRPSYIKLDRDLVSGVDVDGARHAFIESMVRFARQIGSRLIAEGIETEGELACIAGLGVEAGQGYFLARPQVGSFVDPSEDSRRMIRVAADRLRIGAALVSVDHIVRPATVIDPEATIHAAYEAFRDDPSLGVLAIQQGSRFAGQVSRRSLEQILSVPGGWDRLAERPVRAVVDHDPLTVLDQLDVIEVASIIAARPAQEVAEDVVVTDVSGRLVGVATVRDVMRMLAEVRHQSRDDVHPLSGLPGAGWVEQEISRRVAAGEPVTTVFVDMDGFSTLNDLGGFVLGDDVIRALARCLAGVTGGVLHAAAAHLGGDQFVLLVPPRGYEELVAEVVRSAEGEVIPLVRTRLRLCGSSDPCPAISLSMAAVDLQGAPPPGHGHLDWARHELATLMRSAKEAEGYASVHRGPGVVQLSTWTAGTDVRRTISLGQAEPTVVRDALDLVDRSWQAWWEEAGEDDDVPMQRFPGPRSVVERLQATYSADLRGQAEAAAAAGAAVMDVRLDGTEDQLLELLDRLALVTEQVYQHTHRMTPEVALLDRLLRQRARVLVRKDRVIPLDGTGSRGA